MANTSYHRSKLHGVETTNSLMLSIGCIGDLRLSPLYVQVKIIDSRKVFNRIDFLVIPIAGSGEKWVAADSIVNITR
ncbi:MAG: hypothetical protein IH984_07485 [Planctomycetes bacterium]|nr:hypothetical protein [Planctomycetota bacterium]